MSKIQSWLRQSNESEKAFQYFTYFLSLPSDKRTNRQVSDRYTVSEQNIKQIRRRYNWNQRTLDYDNYIASAATRGAAKAAEKAKFDWLCWETEKLEETRIAVDRFFAKAEEILALDIVESETIEKQIFDSKTGQAVFDSEGKAVYQQVTINKPLKFKMSDALRCVESAVIVGEFVIAKQRLLKAAAMTAHYSLYIPKQTKPLEEMTIEELDEYIRQLEIAKEALAKGELPDFTK